MTSSAHGSRVLPASIGACQGCGACLLTCPTSAIRPSGGTLTVIASRCTGCGECVEVCPVDAVHLPGVEPGALAGNRAGSTRRPAAGTLS